MTLQIAKEGEPEAQAPTQSRPRPAPVFMRGAKITATLCLWGASRTSQRHAGSRASLWGRKEAAAAFL